MATKVGINIYINGLKHNSTPQPDTQTAYNISNMVHPGEQFDIQVSNVYDDNSESGLSTLQTFTLLEDTINLTTIVQFYQNVNTVADLNTGTLSLAATYDSGWKNGGYSTKAMIGNNAVYFKQHEAGTRHQGLGVTNTYGSIVTNYFDMDFFILVAGGSYSVREGTTIVYSGSGATANSVFTIRLNNGVLSAEHNGTTVYTSPLTYNYPLTPIGILRGMAGTEGKLRDVQFETTNNLVDNHLFNLDGKTAGLKVTDTALASLYWADIKLSSLWLEIPTTKKYFVLYSTDHGTTADGGIAWAEFDEFGADQTTGFILQGFIERGIIFQGDQIETPRLIRVPSSRSGLTDEICLLTHADQSHPEVATGTQQTILYTTTGGALHTATWTSRGTILGLVAGEDHTGYALPFWDANRSLYVMKHSYSTAVGDSEKGKVSTSPDFLNWTRTRVVDPYVWTNAPTNYIFDKMYTFPFMHNGQKYGFVASKLGGAGTNNGIAITTLDEDNVPVAYVDNILTAPAIRAFDVYYKGNLAYFLIKTTQAGDFYIWEFDMNNIGLYL